MFVRFHILAGALLVATTALWLSVAPSVAALDPTWRADYAATEMVRLINGERASHGLPAVAVDELLTNKSRDGTIACPNDTSLVMLGRAKDMALNDAFSHGLRLCPQYTALDVFATWGYNTYRGEIIAWNNYPVAQTFYVYGCSLAGTNCAAKTTMTTGTVAAAMRGFMGSLEHRDIILGNYDRVGCGAWAGAVSGKNLYACLFSLGGPEHRDRTAPTITGRTGNGRVISTPAAFSAYFRDSWRLSAGLVRLDGKTVSTWTFDHNVLAYRGSLLIDPATLAVGRHTLTWQATDAANHHSALTNTSITFTVTRP